MRKQCLILLSILLAGGILTGCGGNENMSGRPGTEDSAAGNAAEIASSQAGAIRGSEYSGTPENNEMPGGERAGTGESRHTEYPLTVEVKGSDFNTVEQVFEEAPRSILTANASSIEMLYHMGLQDRIIGTIAIDNKPGAEWASLYESLDVIGDKMTISKEVIAAAEPDLIIGRSATFAGETFGSVKELNDLGIRVYSQKASDMSIDVSMQSIIDDVVTLGSIFDVQEEAAVYAGSLQKRLAAVNDTVGIAASEDPLKVMVMASYSDGTYVVFGANARLQSGMLAALNCVNVMEKGGSSLTLENLIEANPDVIIYITSDRNAAIDPLAVESLKQEELLSSVPAIAQERMIEIPYDAFMDYGVRNFDTMEMLAAFLYGQE